MTVYGTGSCLFFRLYLKITERNKKIACVEVITKYNVQFNEKCVSRCSRPTKHQFWPNYYTVTLIKLNRNVSAEQILEPVNVRIVSDEVERK